MILEVKEESNPNKSMRVKLNLSPEFVWKVHCTTHVDILWETLFCTIYFLQVKAASSSSKSYWRSCYKLIELIMSITLISLNVCEDIWLSSFSSNKSLISSRKISKQHTETFVSRLNIFENKSFKIELSFCNKS